MTTLLSVTEAARIAGVGPRTIRRWIADGSLPASRLGPRLIRIKPDDLAALGEPIPSAAIGRRGSR